MKKSNVLILSLVLTIVVGYIGMVIGYNINSNPTNRVSETKVYTPEELAAEINKLRTEKGIPPLKIDERLNQSAYLAARDMQRDNYYDHTNPITKKDSVDYIFSATGTDCQQGNENQNAVDLGIDPVNHPENGWITSPSHNSAQLDQRYDTVGFSSFIANFDYEDETSGVDKGAAIYVAHFCDLR